MRFRVLLAAAFGAAAAALIPLLSLSGDAQAQGQGGGHTPVTICHHAGPDPANWHTITVDDDSVTLQAHLGHGDTIGPCQTVTPPAPEPPAPAPEPPAPSPEPPAPSPEPPANPPLAEETAGSPPPAPSSSPDSNQAAAAPNAPLAEETAAQPTSELAFTGLEAWQLGLLGIALALGGAALYTRLGREGREG